MLVVALLALLVASTVKGQRLPGAAQGVPIPGPPAAGVCLDGSKLLGTNTVMMRVLAYDTSHLVQCSSRHDYEIVGVLQDQSIELYDPQAGAGEPGESVNDILDGCFRQAADYLGTTWNDDSYAGQWSVTFPRVQFALLTPAPLQQHTGQRWAGCLIGFLETDNWQDAPTPITESLRAAGAGGPMTDRTSWCAADIPAATADWQYLSMCSIPHRVQMFASAYTEVPESSVPTGPPSDPGIDACTQVVEQQSRRTGLGSEPGLAIRIVKPTNAPGLSLCVVATTGERTLAGSLTGLGDRPIPWTP